MLVYSCGGLCLAPASPQSFSLDVKLDSGNLSGFGSITPQASVTSAWSLQATVVVTTVGASGTASGSGQLFMGTDAATADPKGACDVYTQAALSQTVDTTATDTAASIVCVWDGSVTTEVLYFEYFSIAYFEPDQQLTMNVTAEDVP